MGASTVTELLRLALPSFTVTRPVFAELTGIVVIVTTPEELPAATVTLAGTLAALLVVLTETANPPIGAGLLSAILPYMVTEPITVEGEMVNL